MIRHIVLIDAARGIAKNGDQPVHLPLDSAHFKNLTTNHGGAILMGRKTYDVIGILKNRQNFVASRNPALIVGATVVPDVIDFLRHFDTDIWVIGGASLYELTLPLAQELYITEVAANLDCDQFYPQYRAGFELVSAGEPQTEKGLTYRFCVYHKSRK